MALINCVKVPEDSDVRTDLDVGIWRAGKLFLPRRAGPTNYTGWGISQVHVNYLNIKGQRAASRLQ